MIEVEIKVRISDPSLIRKRFEEKNGRYKISLNHEDTYYNMPKGLRDFKETDEALRVRKSIEFNKFNQSTARKIKQYITYKGKKLDITTKTREELEIEIEDIERMKTLLYELGFQEVITVKKERELYEFEFKHYQIEALIDYIPILEKYFVEVECLLPSSDRIEDSKEVLFEFLDLFDIRREESIRESYLELILKKDKRN